MAGSRQTSIRFSIPRYSTCPGAPGTLDIVGRVASRGEEMLGTAGLKCRSLGSSARSANSGHRLYSAECRASRWCKSCDIVSQSIAIAQHLGRMGKNASAVTGGIRVYADSGSKVLSRHVVVATVISVTQAVSDHMVSRVVEQKD